MPSSSASKATGSTFPVHNEAVHSRPSSRAGLTPSNAVEGSHIKPSSGIASVPPKKAQQYNSIQELLDAVKDDLECGQIHYIGSPRYSILNTGTAS